MTLPPFSLLRDFSFQNTSEHFALRFRQSYLICYRNWIELKGINMAPNYPVNLRCRVLYWLVRGFRVVDVARILHVWQIFVKKFRYLFLQNYWNTRSVDYQGLEGYFRDPGFDQNTVRDSGKRKIFWRDSGIDYIPGSGIEKNLGTGRGNSCPIVGNSGNFHRLDEYNDRESESNRRVLTGKSLLLKNKNKQLSSVTINSYLIETVK